MPFGPPKELASWPISVKFRKVNYTFLYICSPRQFFAKCYKPSALFPPVTEHHSALRVVNACHDFQLIFEARWSPNSSEIIKKTKASIFILFYSANISFNIYKMIFLLSQQ